MVHALLLSLISLGALFVANWIAAALSSDVRGSSRIGLALAERFGDAIRRPLSGSRPPTARNAGASRAPERPA